MRKSSRFTDRKMYRRPIESQSNRSRVNVIGIHDVDDFDPRPLVLVFRCKHNGAGDPRGSRRYRVGLISQKRVAKLVACLIDRGGDDYPTIRVHFGRRK